MTTTVINGITHLIPTEGHSLTNGDTYSKEVYLSKRGSPADWTEILDTDIPDPTIEVDPLTELEGLL